MPTEKIKILKKNSNSTHVRNENRIRRKNFFVFRFLAPEIESMFLQTHSSMNYFRVSGISMSQNRPIFITVESVMSRRLPFLQIIGCASSQVAQIRERVVAAIEHNGVRMPNRKITVNLSGESGVSQMDGIDLPVALAILGSVGLFPQQKLERVLVHGNLGLDGSLKGISGMRWNSESLKEYRSAILPFENSGILDESQLSLGGGFSNLLQILKFLQGEGSANSKKDRESAVGRENQWLTSLPEEVVRPLQIALSGGHSSLFLDFRPERWRVQFSELKKQSFFSEIAFDTVSDLKNRKLIHTTPESGNDPRVFPQKLLVMPLCFCGFPPGLQRRCACKPSQVFRLQRGIQRLAEEHYSISVELTNARSQQPRGDFLVSEVHSVQAQSKARQNKWNAQLPIADVFEVKEWQSQAMQLLELQEAKFQYAINRNSHLARLALTISDLEQSAIVSKAHVLEAIHYQWEAPLC